MDISIIIPTYNRVDTLLKGLQTLLVQESIEEIEWEIVVVDDGSTDNTEREVKKLIANEERLSIKYVYCEHERVPNRSIVRNMGFFASEGKYISYLDSGMLVAKNYIHNISKKMLKYDIIFHYMYGVFAEYNMNCREIIERIDYNNVDAISAILRKESDWLDVRSPLFDLGNNLLAPWTLGWGGAITFARRLFSEVGKFDETINGWGGEDSDLSLRLIKRTNKYTFCKESFAIHLPHANESSEEKNKFSILNRKKIHHKQYRLDTELYLYYPSLYINNVLQRIKYIPLDTILPKTYSKDCIYFFDEKLKKSQNSCLGHVDSFELLESFDVTDYLVPRQDIMEEFQKIIRNKKFINLLGTDTFYSENHFDITILTDSIRQWASHIALNILRESFRISRDTFIIYTKNFNSLSNKFDNNNWLMKNYMKKICSKSDLELLPIFETEKEIVFQLVVSKEHYGSSTYIEEV